ESLQCEHLARVKSANHLGLLYITSGYSGMIPSVQASPHASGTLALHSEKYDADASGNDIIGHSCQ
ncbi:hypothetical protein QT971_27385, partial [Microcoleus sp. herbarium19]|uniref:hypothetical protein n=1 Tax=unclassified Microcoleus TaxID=2642155 RepID=UPI002FD6D527